MEVSTSAYVYIFIYLYVYMYTASSLWYIYYIYSICTYVVFYVHIGIAPNQQVRHLDTPTIHCPYQGCVSPLYIYIYIYYTNIRIYTYKTHMNIYIWYFYSYYKYSYKITYKYLYDTPSFLWNFINSLYTQTTIYKF